MNSGYRCYTREITPRPRLVQVRRISEWDIEFRTVDGRRAIRAARHTHHCLDRGQQGRQVVREGGREVSRTRARWRLGLRLSSAAEKIKFGWLKDLLLSDNRPEGIV